MSHFWFKKNKQLLSVKSVFSNRFFFILLADKRYILLVLLSVLRKDFVIYFKYHVKSCIEGLYPTFNPSLYFKNMHTICNSIIQLHRSATDLKHWKNHKQFHAACRGTCIATGDRCYLGHLSIKLLVKMLAIHTPIVKVIWSIFLFVYAHLC